MSTVEKIPWWRLLKSKLLAPIRKSWPTWMRSWSESGPGNPLIQNRRDASVNAPSASLRKIRQKHIELDIAVQLIRETRDEA